MDEAYSEHDDNEDLQGAGPGLGFGISARGANFVLDASDAIFFPSFQPLGKVRLSFFSIPGKLGMLKPEDLFSCLHSPGCPANAKPCQLAA